jgi:hypothetical protein
MRALLFLSVLSFPGLVALCSYTRNPRRDVPQWLVVTAADMDRCTLHVQFWLGAAVFIALVLAAMMAFERDHVRAIGSLAAGTWVALTVVFMMPDVMLGARYWKPSWALDPMPYSTDFDYAAYIGQLLPQLVAPLAWAASAAVPAAAGMAVLLWARERRRRRNRLLRLLGGSSVCPGKALAYQRALATYASNGCQIDVTDSRAVHIYGPKGMSEEPFRDLNRRAWRQ